MDIKEARIVLDRIKYKPGFRLAFINVGFSTATLKLSIDNVSKEIPLVIDNMTDSDLVHRVFAEILSWEQHEACEFFSFEGVCIFSPHASVHALRKALSREV